MTVPPSTAPTRRAIALLAAAACLVIASAATFLLLLRNRATAAGGPRIHSHRPHNATVFTDTTSRIAVMTVAFGNEWYYKPSIANKMAYTKRHGYDLIVLDSPARDQPPVFAVGEEPEPHPVWAKVSGLRRHIYDYDWILVVDADAFVANLEVKVEDFVKDVERLHRRRGKDVGNDGVEDGPVSDADGRNVDGGGVGDHGGERQRVGRRDFDGTTRTNPPGPPPLTLLPWPEVAPDAGPHLGPDLVIAMDCNGINAGTFLIRGARRSNNSSPAAAAAAADGRPKGAEQSQPFESRPFPVRLVDFWLAREPMPDVHRTGLMEQEALRTAIEANVLDVRRRVATVPLRVMNSYAPAYSHDCSFRDDPYTRLYEKGDWIVHFVHDSKPSMREAVRELGLVVE
ncbi:hypothetical protein DFJ73DRAFT_892762 [Zopfochytrium polystomum]|nr:hypothetical protein DFJ73DRAFT_892762 [Zopfochytrium polystomum]